MKIKSNLIPSIHIIVVLLPWLTWLALIKMTIPWWLENIISTPYIVILVVIIAFLCINKSPSKIRFISYVTVNLLLATIINNYQMGNTNIYSLKRGKIILNCNNNIAIFQFNMKYNDNIEDNNQLINYLIKEEYDLITLQGVHQQEKKLIINRLKGSYPFYIIGENENKSSVTDQLIFSRYPLKDVTYHKIIDGHPFISSEWIIPNKHTSTGANAILLYTLHPPSPRSKRLWEIRNSALNQLIESFIKDHKNGPLNSKAIVIGDLNIPKTSNRTSYLEELMHTKHINSWPNNDYLSIIFGLAIDHLWISKSAYICSRERIDSFNGSDHYAIKSKIVLNNIHYTP